MAEVTVLAKAAVVRLLHGLCCTAKYSGTNVKLHKTPLHHHLENECKKSSLGKQKYCSFFDWNKAVNSPPYRSLIVPFLLSGSELIPQYGEMNQGADLVKS